MSTIIFEFFKKFLVFILFGNDFCMSRLTWTDSQIVQSVVHKVQQSCTSKKLSMERGTQKYIAVMLIIFTQKNRRGIPRRKLLFARLFFVSVDKCFNAFQRFFDIFHRRSIAAADEAFTACTECVTRYNSNFFFHQQLFNEFFTAHTGALDAWEAVECTFWFEAA